MQAWVAARNSEKLMPLCAETGAKAFTCEATDPGQVARMFAAVEAATSALALAMMSLFISVLLILVMTWMPSESK